MNQIIEKENIIIEDMIYEIRGIQVMFSSEISITKCHNYFYRTGKLFKYLFIEQMYCFILTNTVRECYTYITLLEKDGDIIYRLFKLRLYPNKEQFELINKSFECNIFVYNYSF